ncbi:MAG: hypothetical protein KKB03_00230 [Nanoarchaeota archaeon]|nr:hypothetical protein [Nanoarchaeota archaeon]MBU2519655.1 hypothetical protein [Nanoarchaeota archaeon]
MKARQDVWIINGKHFTSRLLHCFGNVNDHISHESAINFIKHSETDFLTIYTQGNLDTISGLDDFPIGYSGLFFKDLKNFFHDKEYTILVNTNHALTVKDAVKRAEIGFKYSKSKFIKLEVLNHQFTKPINRKVIEASKILLERSFIVMPLINANLSDAKKLEKMGCSAIRVMMSDIGSKKGLINKELFANICSSVRVPIIAEGGLSGPEDAYNAMIAGASAVLTNKALFCYKNPLLLIESLKKSISAGRQAFICNQKRKK